MSTWVTGTTVTENSTSVENNTSNVTINLIVGWNGGSWAADNPRYYINVNGSTVKSGTANFNTGQASSGSQSVATWTGNVPHNDDGTGSMSWAVGYEGIHAYEDIWSTASGTKTLTTIPRASAITSAPNFNIEDGVTLTVNKKSASFTDKLTIKIGNNTIKTINDYSSGTKITFTDAEQLKCYNLITDWSTSFTFLLQTYNGGTLIGSDTKTPTGTIKGDVTYHTGGQDKKATFYIKKNGVVKRCITYDGTKRAYR